VLIRLPTPDEEYGHKAPAGPTLKPITAGRSDLLDTRQPSRRLCNGAVVIRWLPEC